MTKMKKISQPKVSIIIVTWNGKKYAFDLIDSLKKIKYKNYDLIVVDNGSTDGIQKEIKKKYSKVATLIENRKNLGLAEGTNIGIRESIRRKSKYVLVMNQDLIVKPDFLDILVDAMERNLKVSVSGPKIYYMEPKNMIWSAGCDYHIYGFKSRHQREMEKGQDKKNIYVDAIDCVLMLRNDVLKKHGLLDSKLFIVHELSEWALRTKRFGYKALYVPKSVVWHKVASSPAWHEANAAFERKSNENKTSIYYNIRNWLLVIKKNKPIYYFLLVLFLETTLFALIRAIRYAKHGKLFLMKTYYIAVGHALINKTPLRLYPYK